MKKLTAILLCILCIVSSVAVTASAEGGMIEKISSIIGLETDDNIGYGIFYDSNKTASGVTGIIYEPRPTVTIRDAGTYTITDDIPLAFDYEFVCWLDKETGKTYRAGDKYYVNGQKTLYAVWTEKTDGLWKPIRVLVTAFEALKRGFQSFIGVFTVKSEADPTTDLKDDSLFSLDELMYDKEYVLAKDSRTFEFKVKLVDGIPYESFSRTEDIYIGGYVTKDEKVEIGYLTDANGDLVYDSLGRPIEVEKIVFENNLHNPEKYSALYESKGYNAADEANDDIVDGYQIIRVTITDGAPDAFSNTYIAFELPQGILRYKADGQLRANKAYSYRVLTPVTF